MKDFLFKVGSLLIDLFLKDKQEKEDAKKDFKTWLGSVRLRAGAPAKLRAAHKRLKEKLRKPPQQPGNNL